MNNYGTVLDDIGFSPMLQDLSFRFIKPLAAVLFPDNGAATIDR